jgi:cytochrome o ubiquinol oxidase subunit 2
MTPVGPSACQAEGILDPQGPIAAAERLILMNSTGIMLVVVVPVIILILTFAWWYRASNKRAAYRPEWSYSGQIEMVVWAIPAMVVILLAGVGWTGSHRLDPARKIASSAAPIRIQVIALDWKWLFIYPDQGVAAVNEVVIPTGTPVEFLLSSATVMNAFFVPQLGSQIYTMPGMAVRLNLLADHTGDYPGFSSHFSGDGFSDMRFMVHAIPPAQFPAWVERTRGDGARLDTAAYARLAAAQAGAPVQTFRDVERGLFDRAIESTAHEPVTREPAAREPDAAREEP